VCASFLFLGVAIDGATLSFCCAFPGIRRSTPVPLRPKHDGAGVMKIWVLWPNFFFFFFFFFFSFFGFLFSRLSQSLQQEVCDFVVSKMEFLRKNERFLVFCDERRDRSQLVFPEHETLKESGVPSGTTLVFRQTGQDLYFILDREGGINLSSALTHPSRTVVRVDLFAPLRANAAAVAARLGAGAASHELAFFALADRGTRALRLDLSLHAQQISSVVVVQPAAVLLKTSLEGIANVARAGWLVKKSIKHDKVTKNKRRWCVLADLRLYYFKSNTALARPAGVIFLEYYSVSDKSMSGQFLLQHLPDAGRNSAPDFVLSLESFNEKELDDWKWRFENDATILRCWECLWFGQPVVLVLVRY
jgi:hypothetical protein